MIDPDDPTVVVVHLSARTLTSRQLSRADALLCLDRLQDAIDLATTAGSPTSVDVPRTFDLPAPDGVRRVVVLAKVEAVTMEPAPGPLADVTPDAAAGDLPAGDPATRDDMRALPPARRYQEIADAVRAVGRRDAPSTRPITATGRHTAEHRSPLTTPWGTDA